MMDPASHVKNYSLILDGSIKPDLTAVVDRSRAISARLNGGVAYLMKKNKIDVIWGEAKLTKPNEIIVGRSSKTVVEPQNPVPRDTSGEGTYMAKHIIVATGARPRAIPVSSQTVN